MSIRSVSLIFVSTLILAAIALGLLSFGSAADPKPAQQPASRLPEPVQPPASPGRFQMTMIGHDKTQAVLLCNTATGECWVNSLEWVQMGEQLECTFSGGIIVNDGKPTKFGYAPEVPEGSGWRSLGSPAPIDAKTEIIGPGVNKKNGATADSNLLQGAWVAVSGKADFPVKKLKEKELKDLHMILAGNVIVLANGKIGTFQVDPHKTPKGIDITMRGELPDPFPQGEEEKPRRLLGIYALEGDQLTLCLQEYMGDLGRPEAFKAGPGRKVVVFKHVPLDLEEDDLQQQSDVIITGKVTKVEVSDKKQPAKTGTKEKEHQLTVSVGKVEKGKLAKNAKTVVACALSKEIEGLDQEKNSVFGHNSTYHPTEEDSETVGIAEVVKEWELRLYLKKAGKDGSYTLLFPNGFEVLKKPELKEEKKPELKEEKKPEPSAVRS